MKYRNNKSDINEGGINMVSSAYKTRVTNLIEKAKNKGMIKTYSEFCNTKIGQKTKLTEDEIVYYTSKKRGE